MLYLLTCVIDLEIPYLYDRKEDFFRHANKHHVTKDGMECIVRARGMKDSSSLVTTCSMKRVVNINKNLVLIVAK